MPPKCRQRRIGRPDATKTAERRDSGDLCPQIRVDSHETRPKNRGSADPPERSMSEAPLCRLQNMHQLFLDQNGTCAAAVRSWKNRTAEKYPPATASNCQPPRPGPHWALLQTSRRRRLLAPLLLRSRSAARRPREVRFPKAKRANAQMVTMAQVHTRTLSRTASSAGKSACGGRIACADCGRTCTQHWRELYWVFSSGDYPRSETSGHSIYCPFRKEIHSFERRRMKTEESFARLGEHKLGTRDGADRRANRHGNSRSSSQQAPKTMREMGDDDSCRRRAEERQCCQRTRRKTARDCGGEKTTGREEGNMSKTANAHAPGASALLHTAEGVPRGGGATVLEEATTHPSASLLAGGSRIQPFHSIASDEGMCGKARLVAERKRSPLRSSAGCWEQGDESFPRLARARRPPPMGRSLQGLPPVPSPAPSRPLGAERAPRLFLEGPEP